MSELKRQESICVSIGQKYEHFKYGGIYEVVDLTYDTDTYELQVVYTRDGANEIRYNRSLGEFTSLVDTSRYTVNGNPVPRFKYVEG